MRRSSTLSGSGGRPWGGPCCFCVIAAIAALTLPACGARAGPERPQPVRGGAFTDPLDIYHDMGFMTGPAQFPVVASMSTLAGPADSAFAVLALSIPNSALRFQREGTGFFAEYDVGVELLSLDSTVVQRSRKREVVRVASFNETGRTDESVVHQQYFTLPAGSYLVEVDASDAHSSRGSRLSDTLHVPEYGADAIAHSPLLLVYEASGRTERERVPLLIANARHTVPYGGGAPQVYIESYGEAPVDLSVRALNGDSVVWAGPIEWPRGDRLRYALIEIPPAVLPLGRLTLELVGVETGAASIPLVLAISDQWMVANLDDVLQFMRFIATETALDSLRTGAPADRRRAWERFWAERDPLPVTAANEFRDQFFDRVRYATEAFRETAGRAGWDTDRGEVYIVLGPPDRAQEVMLGRNDLTDQPNAEEWVYHSVGGYRLNLTFHDRTGFGRYELTPSSAADFRSAAERLKRTQPDARGVR